MQYPQQPQPNRPHPVQPAQRPHPYESPATVSAGATDHDAGKIAEGYAIGSLVLSVFAVATCWVPLYYVVSMCISVVAGALGGIAIARGNSAGTGRALGIGFASAMLAITAFFSAIGIQLWLRGMAKAMLEMGP